MIEDKAALLVSADVEDHKLLGEIFAQQGWTLYNAARLDRAVAFLY